MTDVAFVHRQESSLTFFLSLVSGKLKPGKLWYGRTYRIKYLLRSLAYPVSTKKLINALSAEPAMRDILPVQHTLPAKIHRPYLYSGMPVAQRVQAIIDHYQFAKSLPSVRLRQAMLTEQGVELIHFEGKNGEAFSIVLACTGRCEREGEVNLFITCNGVRLAMLTFAVIRQQEEKVLIIGGMQGAHRDTPHEIIREATKACYGLFPKRLLMETLVLFAAATGITRFQAVSDQGHIFRSLRYRLKKQRLFHASYNEFWETLDARPLSRTLYALPLGFPRKPVEEIASKKRAEARRRYALLGHMSTCFTNSVSN